MYNGMKFEEIDDFDKIPDLVTSFKLLKAWGLESERGDDKPKVVRRLIDHWLANREPPSHNEINGNYTIDSREQTKIREGLVEKSRNSEKFFNGLPKKLKGSLLKAFPDFVETLRSKVEELSSGELYIIVAGEVGAGKSSLINLLLGTDLLPTHQLRCTNTICEIRNSRGGRKEAIAYPKSDSDGGDSASDFQKKNINLEGLKGIQELRECLTSVNEYDDSPYDKVEIYWPLKLGDGVVLVDTPGVEGGSNVDMCLQQYLTKAFGFIYVINTNAAGGVQHSRLGALLKTVVNAAEDFSPETSLFIGNKWENIPEKDRKDVREEIFRKLDKVYPGITEEQLHFMSVMKSKETYANHMHRRKEHRQLLSKIEQLTYNSLRVGIEGHYSWLSSFLNKSLHLIRVANHKDNLSKEELEVECSKLKQQIKQLQKDTDESLNELKRKIEFHIFKITKEITDLLPSRSVLASLCDWTEEACAQPNKKWKLVAEEASCQISKRVQKIVDHWESSNKILKKIDEEIIDVFVKEFGLMEHQVNELEDSMYKSRNRDVLGRTFVSMSVKSIFKHKTNQIEKTYRTLGGAVSCVGGLDTSKKNVRKAFKDYKKNPVATMSEATVLFIERILQHKDLQGKLKRFFNTYFADIDTFAKKIPGFLQADQVMIDTMSQKLQESLEVALKYPELHKTCKDNLSKLDTFYVNYIMKFDYKNSDLSQGDMIGSGSYANVFKGVLTDSGKEVAVKIAKDVVKMSNVTDVLTEDKIMRDLKHKNIVHYFGATNRRKSDGIIWIMVMELCKASLKDFYFKSRKAKAPGGFPDGHPMKMEAVQQFVSFALQICDGLAYIHEKGYTHRDLKMENILLSTDCQIKLTDVGVAKPTNLLGNTVVGSPAYMAPEVLLSLSDQTNKTDIYSISFILWEMWYGRDIAIMLNEDVLGVGFGGDAMEAYKKRQSESDGGFRPSLTMTNKPPKDLMDVLKQSWSTDPENRPTAAVLVKFFNNFLKNIE